LSRSWTRPKLRFFITAGRTEPKGNEKEKRKGEEEEEEEEKEGPRDWDMEYLFIYQEQLTLPWD
jgi:hypothetical protein